VASLVRKQRWLFELIIPAGTYLHIVCGSVESSRTGTILSDMKRTGIARTVTVEVFVTGYADDM